MEERRHSLDEHRPRLYNPVTGEVGHAGINVADSITIRDATERKYADGLPVGFYCLFSNRIMTMSVVQKQMVEKRVKRGNDLKYFPVAFGD